MEIQKEKKDKKSRVYLFILMGILIILNVMLGLNLYWDNIKKKELTAEVSDKNTEIEALQKQLDAYEKELQAYQSDNAELNSLLEEKKKELEEKTDRLRRLLEKGNLSESELRKARLEILNLRTLVDNQRHQLDSLVSANKILIEENQVVKSDLAAEQTKVANLTQDKEFLTKKVAIGARLKARDIVVTGVKRKKSGKEDETMRASKMDEIKIVFTLDENKVADPGQKDIYLKLIAPDGSPLAVSSTGSGTFTVDGTQSIYTTKKVINFDQDAQSVSIYWNKGSDYAKGEYVAEIFADGFKIGEKKFTLK